MWVDGGRRGSSENIIRVLVSSGPRGGWMPSCRGTCVGAVDDYYYFYGQCYCCCKERRRPSFKMRIILPADE